MKHFPQIIGVLALATILPLIPVSSAQAADPLVQVGRSIPTSPLLARAQLVGPQSAQTEVSAVMTLPLRNQAELQTMLKQVYTPGSPLYGHYLTPAQFATDFGPTASDYQAVVNYAKAQGLTVKTYSSRTLVGVSAPTGTVEKAFHVQLNRYRVPSGRIAYANTQAPLLPSSIASRINGIVGLDSLLKPHPEFLRRPVSGGGVHQIGNDSSGGLTPSDIKSIYNLNNMSLQGEGQSLGLVELDGYNSGDIDAYVTKYNLPVNPSILYNIYTGGFDGTPGSGQTEVVLDIDMMLALAPRASRIYVYEAPNTTGDFLELYTQIADDDFAKSISCSWGEADTDLQATYDASQYAALMNAENQAFEQMAVQGQSFFDAAGDNGAYDDGLTLSVDDPAQQPFVTAVGGTTLSPSNPGTAQIGYGTESAWGSKTEIYNDTLGSGSGGGFSDTFTKPYYQFQSFSIQDPSGAVGFSAGEGEALANVDLVLPQVPMRDVPDVALNADPASGYAIYVASDDTPGFYPNDFEVVGGTSAAAPLWAAFTALANEARAANGVEVTPGSDPGTPTVPIGFVNPLIYEIGYGLYGTYSSDFHDINDGSNNLEFVATPGYDDATGWGSFNGVNLISAMATFAQTGSTNGSGSSTGAGTTASGTTVVSGTVTFDGAAPPTGVAATITARATNGTADVSATTNSSGAYTLSVPTGLTYTMTATATGYLTQTITNQVFTASVATVPFTLTDTAAAQAHSFPAGIEMISEPYDFSSTGDDFAGLFGLSTPISSSGPQLYLWQPQANSYAQYPNAPADTLRPGVGYWLRVPSSDTSGLTLQVAGSVISTSTPFMISLQQGWNQIGDPFLSSISFSNISVALDSTGTDNQPLTNASGMVSPTLYSYPAGATNYTAVTSSLQPYLGYWIYAYQPVYLTFNPLD